MQSSLPTAPQVEHALARVYARPEFAAATPQHSWWEALLKPLGRLFRWIVHLFEGFKGLEVSAPWIYWMVVVWLGVSALAILVHLILTAISAVRWRERKAGADEEQALAAPRGATDWEAEARRAAAEGRMRDAAIALYQALLLRLDQRGALRFDPAKTPGDYRREVRRHPELAPPFATFLRGFEPVAFGGRPLDGAGYERLRETALQAGARG